MSPITTHVLDTTLGRPARAVSVVLQKRVGHTWRDLAEGATDADGRIKNLLPAGARLDAGIYRLAFDTEDYFREQGMEGFYPEVAIVFKVEDPDRHYHVPLLLSPFGYSTYRGT